MTTNRHRRARLRQVTVDDEMVTFFLTGKAPSGSDLEWNIFADIEKIFSAWDEVKDVLKRQRRRILAAMVFEGTGKNDCFTKYPWINRVGYQEWKSKDR